MAEVIADEEQWLPGGGGEGVGVGVAEVELCPVPADYVNQWVDLG